MPNEPAHSLAGKWIVETDWLHEHLDAPDLVILDASWHLPASDRNAVEEYNEAHIPGAIRFDIDDIADDGTELPHMLPSTVKFASRMKKMGVGDGMRIVVYNAPNSFSAPRVWWTFRVMGIEDVAVLNGGLSKWRSEKRPLEDMPPARRSPRHLTPRFNAALLHDLDDMQAILQNGGRQIVDTRSSGRFAGSVEEPRAGLRSGHIPGSLNLPSSRLFNRDETFKSPAELAGIFTGAGIDTSKPIVTTCGSGVTASILALGLAIAGTPDAAVYDGSWSEWGADDSLPLEAGPAAQPGRTT